MSHSGTGRGSGPEDVRQAFWRGLLILTTAMIASARYGGAVPQHIPSDVAGGAGARRWDPRLEYTCDRTQLFGVDFLNDAEVLPHALSVTSGSVAPGESAEFRVLSANYATEIQDLTDYFRKTRYHSRGLKVDVQPAPGSRGVAGKLRLVWYGNLLRLRYTPLRTVSEDRTAVFTFTLLCDRSLTTEFTLRIPGGRSQ
jgi:hypothetical protein